MRVLLRAAAIAGTAIVCATFAPPARAFCGFYVAPSDQPLYNDASMVALLRDGTRTVMTLSNNYKGPAADFAMVVPVPVVLHEGDVKTLSHGVFERLEALSAPRLVEYWEQDPCPSEEDLDDKSGGTGTKHKGAEGMMGDPSKDTTKDYGVTIEDEFVAGEYQIVILGAEQSDGLERWLNDNGYKVPSHVGPALAPYIAEQQKFFVARVDVSKVKRDPHGAAVLSPLRFAYESESFRLPVRLGLVNAQSKQDLIVFVLSRDGRYDVANYTNAFVPTNIDVADSTRDAFAPFYAELFDATMAKAGGKAVITEYAWSASSCDPCPTPPLDDVDVARLGGDVLFGLKSPDADANADAGTPNPYPNQGYYGSNDARVTLTRLHTRYDSSTLSEDIVFRKAPPVVGGREFVTDEETGGLEQGAKPDETNNFQARYAIRHPWTGAILCDDPERGVWGGPPGENATAPKAKAATDLAAASRGQVSLASLALSPVPELGLNKRAAPAGARPGYRWEMWREILVFTVAPFAIVAAAIALAIVRRVKRDTPST